MEIHRKPLSIFFPAYHPKAGQPTYFVEKLYNSIYADKDGDWSATPGPVSNYMVELDSNIEERKHTTIRAGHKVKVGDFIQFYCWTDKPYRSKQIVIAPPIEVKRQWSFQIDFLETGKIYLNGNRIYEYPYFKKSVIDHIAENDGLDLGELLDWFKYPKPFDGQIICWNDKTQYT